MRIRLKTVPILTLMIGHQGCASQALVDDLASSFIENGATCSNAEFFRTLSESDQEYVINTVLAAYGENIDDFKAKGQCEVGARSGMTDEDGGGMSDLDFNSILRHTTSGGWVYAANPETGSGGTYPYAVYRDSASSEWMCNSGNPATWYDPADYIGVTYVAGSHANPNSVRVKGTNIWANAYLSNSSNSSRVNTDDHVAMCIGYWSVFFSGAIVPLTLDFKTQR